MKRLFLVVAIAATVYACGPSSESTGDTDTPVNVSSSPTADSAVIDQSQQPVTTDTTRTTSDTATTTTPNPTDTSSTK